MKQATNYDWPTWQPSYDGHKPDLTTEKNVQHCNPVLGWLPCKFSPGWFRSSLYRFPAADLKKPEPTWIEWKPERFGHKPALKTERNVQYLTEGGGWVSPLCRQPIWTTKDTYRFLAEDLLAPAGGPELDPLPSLPEDADTRNQYPMAEGLLDYFPNALAEVSRLSHLATQQHHPDQPMHWDRDKSTDHANKILRHLVDRGKVDDKGLRHSAMVAWRALAMLQEELEKETGAPLSRASRTKGK